MSKKKNIKRIILVVILAIIIMIAVMFVNLMSVMKKSEKVISAITFTQVDITTIPNGTYIGDFEAGLVYVKVTVTVNEGMITDIKLLEHKNGKGSFAEQIIDDMIAKQTLEVDAVSGATYSSKVIRKAVENALTIRYQ